MVNRRMLVIAETKTDISVPHFQEKFEADERQGTIGEDYSSEVMLMYGIDSGIIEDSDWWNQEFDENPHRDCVSELHCTQGVMLSQGFGSIEMLVMHKCSEDNPVTATSSNELYDERIAYNTENNIETTVTLYPADAHWNIDWENPIT